MWRALCAIDFTGEVSGNFQEARRRGSVGCGALWLRPVVLGFRKAVCVCGMVHSVTFFAKVAGLLLVGSLSWETKATLFRCVGSVREAIEHKYINAAL